MYIAYRSQDGFFTSFGKAAGDADGYSGNFNCPDNTRATGFSFLPNDFGFRAFRVSSGLLCEVKMRADWHLHVPANLTQRL